MKQYLARKLNGDYLSLFVFSVCFILFWFGILVVNFLDYIVEFRIFASLVLICCIGTSGVVLFSSIFFKAHLLVSVIPFIVVEELLIILTIVLLFNLHRQDDSWNSTWAFSFIDLVCHFATLLLLIFAAIRRRNQLNKLKLHQDEDQNMIEK